MANDRFTPPFTDRQTKTFAVVQRISASCSMVGSCCIIGIILANRRAKLKTVYHRLLLMMSSMDFIFAVKQLIGQWAVPAGEPTYGSAGRIQTCTAFGFLGQGAALSSIYYSGFLTLFFFLVIRLGWSEERIRKTVEPAMHVVALTVGWGTAIAGLPLELYNRGSTGCWIAEKPPGCQESYNAKEGQEVTCTRGDNASLYRWVFFWGQLWIIWLFCVLALTLIYMGIRQAEQKSASRELKTAEASTTIFVETPSSQELRVPTAQPRKNSQKFAQQALFYCTFFFLTWVFATIHTTLQSTKDKVYSPLILLTVFFIPLQGFCNFCVYMRPRYIRFRKQQGQGSLWSFLSALLAGSRQSLSQSRHAARGSSAARSSTLSAAPSVVVVEQPPMMSSEQPRSSSEGEGELSVDNQPDLAYLE